MLVCNDSKTCCYCKMELSLEMFHKNRSTRDGLQKQCKICRALNVNEEKRRVRSRRGMRKYRKRHPVSLKIKRRIWLEKHPGDAYRATVKYKKTHRKQVNVRNMVYRHLKKGKIKRKDCCEKCGSLNLEIHHEDYDKPLEVAWLCRRCHGKRHRKLI